MGQHYRIGKHVTKLIRGILNMVCCSSKNNFLVVLPIVRVVASSFRCPGPPRNHIRGGGGDLVGHGCEDITSTHGKEIKMCPLDGFASCVCEEQGGGP